jgi:hypothetical protein
MKKNSTMSALLDACRYVAAERLEEAAQGRASKVHTFLAVVTLEAAHAWLTLRHGDAELEAPTEAADASMPPPHDDLGRHQRMVEIPLGPPMEPMTFTFFPEQSKHGSN